MAGRGRPAGTYTRKKYDLYEIKKNGHEVFVCRADKCVIKETYGINTNNIAKDIRDNRPKKGYEAKKYRIYSVGAKDKVQVPKRKITGMPNHVKGIKCSSGARFEG